MMTIAVNNSGIFGGVKRFFLKHDNAQIDTKNSDDKLYQAGKYPLRNLLKTLKTLWQEQSLTLPDDFLDDLVKQGNLLPAQKNRVSFIAESIYHAI